MEKINFWHDLKLISKYTLVIFLLAVIFFGIVFSILIGWNDEENIEKCMAERPEYTYEQCESAVVW